MQAKQDLQRQLGGLRSMYERASDEKKSMLKASIEKKEAELAKLPSKRELNVIKARDNLELRQAEATLARTKATQLRQHLQAVQNSRYMSVRDIDDLRRDIQLASASETAKGQEVKSAKERLAKAEDYLKKGQAATQGQKSGLPSLNTPERLQEAIPIGNADNFNLDEGDNDKFLEAFIEIESKAAEKEATAKAAQAAHAA
ncbi:MAG: hypothetical protein Q9171_006679 [Xanthocarpia ochracea]